MLLKYEIEYEEEDNYEFGLILNLVEGGINIQLYVVSIHLEQTMDLTSYNFKAEHTVTTGRSSYQHVTENIIFPINEDCDYFPFSYLLQFDGDLDPVCVNAPETSVEFPNSDEFKNSLFEFEKFLNKKFKEILNRRALDTIKEYVDDNRFTESAKDVYFKPFYESEICESEKFAKIYETAPTDE